MTSHEKSSRSTWGRTQRAQGAGVAKRTLMPGVSPEAQTSATYASFTEHALYPVEEECYDDKNHIDSASLAQILHPA